MNGVFLFDKDLWCEKMMDMPFSRPCGDTPEQAMEIPGNCVKSKERERFGGFPKYHGRILIFNKSEDKVIILSHNDGFSKPLVWRGSVQEYFLVWNCD